MALQLRDGDYIPDNMGSLCRVEGLEALLQRALFRLKARRGQFPFLENMGSRLWLLGRVPRKNREAAAKQYVVEALAPEDGLIVQNITLIESGSCADLTAELAYQNETLSLSLSIDLF